MKIREKQILVALVCGALSFNFSNVSAQATDTTSAAQTQTGGVQPISPVVMKD